MRFICAILLALCLVVSGCGSADRGPEVGASLSTAEGMGEYLQSVPAVKHVEPWQNDFAAGIQITTEHYEIYTTLLEPLMLRQLPGFVESAYRAYQDQLPSPVESKAKFIVYLFATRGQWETFTKSFVGPQWPMYMNIKKGAYYLNGACVAYNIGRTRTFAVLGHEGWHQFNSRHFAYRLPSWLDEGIAVQFEISYRDNGFFKFTPERNAGRLGSLKKTIQAGGMIALNDLIALNPAQVIEDTDKTLAFYSQAYALVRFLREDNYGRRLSRYHDMLLGALRGNWPLDDNAKMIAANRNIPMTAGFNSYVSRQIFSIYIDEDIALLEDEYQTFCKRIVYRVRLNE